MLNSTTAVSAEQARIAAPNLMVCLAAALGALGKADYTIVSARCDTTAEETVIIVETGTDRGARFLWHPSGVTIELLTMLGDVSYEVRKQYHYSCKEPDKLMAFLVATFDTVEERHV